MIPSRPPSDLVSPSPSTKYLPPFLSPPFFAPILPSCHVNEETVATDNVKYLFIQKTSQADIFVSFLPKYVTLPICCSRNFLHPR